MAEGLDTPVLVLHRYFLWADRMRVHWHEQVKGGIDDPLQSLAEPYLAYWYAGMYVVVEGWRRLGLTDPRVDDILASPNVRLLKRFRHGVYHFQARYLDSRLMDYMTEARDSVPWIHELREALSEYFLAWFRARRTDPPRSGQ